MPLVRIPLKSMGADIPNFQNFTIGSESFNSTTGASFWHHIHHEEHNNFYLLRETLLHIEKIFPQLHVVIGWVRQLAVITGVEESIVWILLSALFAIFVYRIIFRGLFRTIFRSRRDLVLLIGLPSSGKTALLSQIAYGCVPSTQTSIQPNRLAVEAKKGGKVAVQRTVVDHPGHPRLRGSLPRLLASTNKLVVVIDSITIHDDRYGGAHALADLLLVVLQSSAFSGVKAVLFACTKRDEMTSYSARAIQKLLEMAMARALTSRKGDLERVNVVVDSKGKSIGKAAHRKDMDRGRKFQVDERGAFSFDQLGVPYRFVEVSSFPNEAMHPFSAQSVLDFIV